MCSIHMQMTFIIKDCSALGTLDFVIPVFRLLDIKTLAKTTDIAVSFFPAPWSWGLGAPTPLAVLHLMLREHRGVAGSYFRGDFPPLHGL